MPTSSFLGKDHSETERLDVSKYSNSSFMISGNKDVERESPFINYSDNEDAQRRQDRALIQGSVKKKQKDDFGTFNINLNRYQKEGGSKDHHNQTLPSVTEEVTSESIVL